MGIEIVEMEEKYLDSALAVYQSYVVGSTATFQIADATVDQMKSLLFFDVPRYRSFAVLESGVFAGYGIVEKYRQREAYDNTAEITIYLASGATGKGYGKTVVAHLEDFARSRGLHVLISQISGENGASQKLFERCGYAKCAHYHEVGYKFGRWLDLVCYEKKL